MKTIQQFKYALIALLFVVPNILAQPTLLTPTNGATNVSVSPTLTWTDILSTTYRVEVATDAAFSTLVYTNNGVAGTSNAVPFALANYTLHYWHVRESAPSTGAYSTTFTFMTVPSATPATTTLGTPVDGATGVSLSPTFTWAVIPETDTYTFELATDALFGSIVNTQSGLTSPTASVAGLSTSTTYYWRVRGTNFLGTGSNSTPFSFTTLGAPTLTSPANTISGVSIQTAFGWSTVPTAASYDLDVATDAGFTAIVVAKTGLAATSYTLDSLEILDNITNYYWRVKADITPFSSTSSFMTIPSAMPVPNSPIGNATVFTLTPVLYWHLNQPITNIVYDVQYKRVTDASYTQAATNTALQTVTLPTLDPNTTYLWRVIGKRVDGRVSSYTADAVFKTAFGGDPVASWPLAAQTVYTTTPTLYWYHNEPQLTNRYLVEVNTASDFTGTVVFKDSTTSQNITTTTLDPGYYYWRVHSTSTITEAISGWSSGSFLVYFATTPDVTLSWPINGESVYTVQPDLNWYLDSAYTGITFNVEYSTTSAVGPWTSAGSTGSQFIAFPIYVVPGTTYYWRVQATSPSTGDGAWTAAESFVVDPLASGQPTVPIISWPTAGSTIYSFNHDMNWYLDGPIDGLVFDGDIATDAGFTNLVASWTGLTTLYYSATLPNAVATYFWRVKSRNPLSGVESAYATTATAFTVNPTGTVAPTPILDYPTNGTVVWTPTQTLFWYTNDTPAGTNFQVQVSIYGNFSVLVASNAADTAAGYTADSYAIPVSLDPGYTYYWRVRSRIGVGHEDWGSWVSTYFITDPGFSAIQPRIGGPSSGVNVYSSTVNLNWFDPIRSQNQAKYDVQYSVNSDFSAATTVSNVTAKTLAVSGLTTGTKYYWRVRAIGKDLSISGYSQPESFVPTQATDVPTENVVPMTFTLAQNYPNPFNPTTVINYAIPQNAVVTLSIYNMLGQKIKTLVSEQKNAGTYSVQWKGDNEFGQKVSSGAYIYRINAGSFVKSMKMILMK